MSKGCLTIATIFPKDLPGAFSHVAGDGGEGKALRDDEVNQTVLEEECDKTRTTVKEKLQGCERYNDGVKRQRVHENSSEDLVVNRSDDATSSGEVIGPQNGT